MKMEITRTFSKEWIVNLIVSSIENDGFTIVEGSFELVFVSGCPENQLVYGGCKLMTPRGDELDATFDYEEIQMLIENELSSRDICSRRLRFEPTSDPDSNGRTTDFQMIVEVAGLPQRLPTSE